MHQNCRIKIQRGKEIKQKERKKETGTVRNKHTQRKEETNTK
jgi:hypothetical protein